MSQTFGGWLFEKTWETLLKRIITCTVVVAVLVAGYVGVRRIAEKAGACAGGVSESGGECIGVNGSGYDWGVKEIGPIVDRIKDENDKLDGAYVTVAMMLPLQPESAAEKQQLRSELQGAYIAQYRANREEGAPKVRLVLANPGKDYAHQDEVVPELVEMAHSKHRLRAVTGFNLSLESTREALSSLTDQGVPVLVARASAGSLANVEGKERRFKGLARILPTNEDQARALADFNGSRRNEQTVVVRDTRNDPYVRSLADAFQELEKQEKGPSGPDTMTFTSDGIAVEGDVDNQFRPMVDTICSSGADTVYFAGRSTHLRLFLKRLAQDRCEDTKFTVVSGSDGASLKNKMSEKDWAQLVDDSGEPKMTVQYAAPAHPDAWRTEVRSWQDDEEKRTKRRPDAAKAPGSLREPLNELAALRESAETGKAGTLDLADSRTMMVHDGVRTAVEAIRGAKLAGETAPTLQQVGNRWATMQATNRVNGTSGRICLTPSGNAYNKPLAVVRLQPGEKKGTSRLGYVGLAWPLERKQAEDCVVRGR
ncbi:ABC transporter substrate-binding protein [Streptomyces sp. NRRL S-1521]|uniref:ABC transporter substrate-binding protein n=1 Tax=Streptomyces sp. NRRL S-1521 TaxID=1609100 RepID=UPI0007C79646|nr:ABC transporter substrate-binding protein [Streptomyces sp. NRRL S-1521]